MLPTIVIHKLLYRRCVLTSGRDKATTDLALNLKFDTILLEQLRAVFQSVATEHERENHIGYASHDSFEFSI
jgi:hypothetical protein